MKKNKTSKKPIWQDWRLWVGAVVAIAIIGGIAGANGNGGQQGNSGDTSTNADNGNNFKPGEEFAFDDLTLKVSPNYSFDIIDNEFSDDNGKTVVAIPITVTNNSNEAKTLNMYSYKGYGKEGVELSNPSAYFMEKSVDFGGNLQPGKSYTKNLYFIYDGDSTYKIEFGFYKTEASVSIDIVK